MRYLWIILFAAVAACNDLSTAESKENNETDSTIQTKTEIKKQDTVCYLAVQHRDSLLLQLYINDSAVTGLMQYDNFEIDGNIGTVQAVRRNNRMEGYFRFFAEGTWSVREIILEQQSDQWLQAETDNMQYSGDTVRFRNKNNLKLDAKRPFNKVDCEVLHFGVLPG